MFQFYKISINSSQNKIFIQHLESGINFYQSFYYYEGMSEKRASGAYIFRPKPNILNNLTSTGPPTIHEGIKLK